MKGILSTTTKNFSKCLTNNNTSNMGKTLNAINFCSFHTENKTKPNSIKSDDQKKKLFSEVKSDIKLRFEDFLREAQFSLSRLFCSYYYKLQVSNMNKFMKDFSVLHLSGNKSNLNGNNKNLNEEEVDFKLNESSKENNNFDGK